MNAMRLSKDSVAVWLSWLLTGLILLLVCLFSALIVRDYGRENEAARQTIQEKGSVLIRALESGARVGMGMRMHLPTAGVAGGDGLAARRAVVRCDG